MRKYVLHQRYFSQHKLLLIFRGINCLEEYNVKFIYRFYDYMSHTKLVVGFIEFFQQNFFFAKEYIFYKWGFLNLIKEYYLSLGTKASSRFVKMIL